MWKNCLSKKQVIKRFIILSLWTVIDAIALGVWIAKGRFIFSLFDSSFNAFISEMICVVGVMVIFEWVVFLLFLFIPSPTASERLNRLNINPEIHIEAHHDTMKKQVQYEQHELYEQYESDLAELKHKREKTSRVIEWTYWLSLASLILFLIPTIVLYFNGFEIFKYFLYVVIAAIVIHVASLIYGFIELS